MSQAENTFSRPKKSLGQNFLQDRNICRKIVGSVHISQHDLVLEIGPGRGALTEFLIEQSSELHLIEYDRELVAHWRAQATEVSGLSVHESDVLAVDFSQLTGGRPAKVVGNLPYNISSPILFRLLEQISVVDVAVVMLQKELVQRMAAVPGNKLYGRLSVMLQQAFRIEHLFDVSAQAFYPPPKVESAIARLTPLEVGHSLNDWQVFAEIVKKSFATRRKTLRNNLKGLISAPELESLGVDPGCRAETLDVATFVELANFYADKS